MDNSLMSLLAVGALVGFLVSLDNTAATAALASRFGANLYLLVGEVLAHIVFVSVGWFVGYLLAAYQDVATLVTAGVLFLLGANMQGADLKGAYLNGTNLSNANVKGANFARVKDLSPELAQYLKEHGAINVP